MCLRRAAFSPYPSLWLSFLIAALLPSWAWAESSLEVRADGAPVYSQPDENAEVVSHVSRGRKLLTTGALQNQFIQLKTKSGRSLWLRLSDVNFEPEASDLESPPKRPRKVREDADEGGNEGRDYPRFTYDLGGATGSTNGTTYTEVDFGVTTYFVSFLAWRNALFYRFLSGSDNVYGLDTSVRGVLGLGGRALGLTLFAGPGYRFVNAGLNAPFLEGGAVFKLAGLAIGLGAKTIYNATVSPGTPNDNQIFLILSGGGSF